MTGRLTLGTVLAASLLLGGCGHGSGNGVRSLCGLAELPHETPGDLVALRDEAQRRIDAQDSFAGTGRNKRIVYAAQQIAVFADSDAKLASAPPELRSLFASAQPRALSLDAGLAELRDACR